MLGNRRPCSVLSGSRALDRAAIAGAMAVFLVLAQGAVVGGQERVADGTRFVRVEWALERTRGELWTLCGSVYNDYYLPARHVELLIETRDSADSPPRRRVLHSVNDVSPGTRRIFCLPVPSGSTAGRVTVQGIDWGFYQAP